MSMARASRRNVAMDALRAQVAAIERGGVVGRRTVSLGLPALDATLPEGGLALGAVHEATGPVAAGLVAMVAAQLEGPLLWCVDTDARALLYGPGLDTLGLHPARIVIARCRGQTDLLWAMEEGLRTSALAAVVGEPPGIVDLTASRRLQLAAEAGDTLGIVLNSEKGVRFAASALESRWRIDSAPAGDIARPRWKVVLERCRGGIREPHWMVERDEETGHFAVVAALADRPVAAL
ncbi:MAG: damage-inducible mutagenesis protein [Rhodospirillaceae bacterium]|nr:damage-inducible mutagenesis protein [Rhodospirillaceae bacterium]